MASNPNLGKRGGEPETGILPKSRGGAASVTTNPSDPGQQARLQQYLFTKQRQQYETSLQRLAGKYGVTASGRLTDPTALFNLRQRAAFAADSITRTYAAQVAAAQANGGTLADLVGNRNAWKPDQIWNTELAWSANAARSDFYDNHDDLAASATVHAEPPDAAEPECEDAVGAGSVPYGDIPLDFPAHVGCVHEWIPDDPSPDTTLVPAGTITGGGDYLPADVPLSSTTASLLTDVAWWVGGLLIVVAAGDKDQNQQPPPADDGTDEED